MLCLGKYFVYDTSVRIEMKNSNQTELPVFTICPYYGKGYKKDILKEKYNLTAFDMRHFNYPRNEDSKQFFNMATYDLSELVKSVKITTKDESLEANSRRFTFDVYADEVKVTPEIINKEEEIFQSINWVSFGRCFTFEVLKEIKKLSVRISNKWFFIIFQHHLPVSSSRLVE